MHRRRTRPLLIATSATLLTLSACGASGSPSNSSATTGSSGSAAPTSPVQLDDATRAQLQAGFEKTCAAATVDGVPTPGAIAYVSIGNQ